MIDEDDDGIGLRDGARQFAQRLRHEPRLQTDVGIAHIAFDFRLWHEGGHGVHDHYVDCPAAYKRFGNLQRLLARVGLRNVQVVHPHAEAFRIDGVERMLRVDERGGTPLLLSLGDHVQRNGGLAGGFRPVDLHDPAAGDAADAKRIVEFDAAGGNDGHGDFSASVAKLHDRTLAKLFFDLTERDFQRFFLFHAHA